VRVGGGRRGSGASVDHGGRAFHNAGSGDMSHSRGPKQSDVCRLSSRADGPDSHACTCISRKKPLCMPARLPWLLLPGVKKKPASNCSTMTAAGPPLSDVRLDASASSSSYRTGRGGALFIPSGQTVQAAKSFVLASLFEAGQIGYDRYNSKREIV